MQNLKIAPQKSIINIQYRCKSQKKISGKPQEYIRRSDFSGKFSGKRSLPPCGRKLSGDMSSLG